MAYVLSSISGNLISAASAGFAPTNSADVSAIASSYQVVSATATQLYAGTAYVTSINDAPISAARAGNAANASMAASAYYDGTGRLISALPDSAAVSGIASAYAESAVSSKADSSALSSYVPYSSLEYNTASAISGINGSALAAGSTYSAGEGIDITDDVISVETPVDIVAGPGIAIDNPDGNTMRVSLSSNEEVVLWNDAAGAFTATLNESLFNFEKIKVFQLTETSYHIQEFYTSDLTSNAFTIGATYQALSNQIYCFSSKWSITNSGVNLESTGKGYGLVGTSGGFTFYPSNVYNGKICRVVGVHRINGGN